MKFRSSTKYDIHTWLCTIISPRTQSNKLHHINTNSLCSLVDVLLLNGQVFPQRLGCFLGELVCQLQSFTAYDSPLLQGRCAAESVLGYMPDISPWVQHAWYEEVWYRDVDKVDKLGLWLGAATRHGGGDVFWILGKSCRPIVRCTVWSVTVKRRNKHLKYNHFRRSSMPQPSPRSATSNCTDDDEINQELEDIFPEPDEDIYLEDDTEEE
jgi:hypothetical protein